MSRISGMYPGLLKTSKICISDPFLAPYAEFMESPIHKTKVYILGVVQQRIVQVLSDPGEHCFPIAIFVLFLYWGIFRLYIVSYIKLEKSQP